MIHARGTIQLHSTNYPTLFSSTLPHPSFFSLSVFLSVCLSIFLSIRPFIPFNNISIQPPKEKVHSQLLYFTYYLPTYNEIDVLLSRLDILILIHIPSASTTFRSKFQIPNSHIPTAPDYYPSSPSLLFPLSSLILHLSSLLLSSPHLSSAPPLARPLLTTPLPVLLLLSLIRLTSPRLASRPPPAPSANSDSY